MVCGVIDLGSNSIRLSFYEYEDRKIKLIINKKVIAGLAADVRDGLLSVQGIKKACDILDNYKNVLQNFHVNEFYVFATASLRNIKNTYEALEVIFKQTGLRPQILSGEEEAYLDFVGAQYFSNLEKGLLIDIGGGSTELVYFEDSKIKNLTSIPIGSLNLHSDYVKGILPSDVERKKIKKHIREHLSDISWLTENPAGVICGVGGTARACLKLSRELFTNTDNLSDKNYDLSPLHINAIYTMLKSADADDYKAVFKIVPERILTITPGVMILREIIKKFRPDNMLISKFGVREGYLLNKLSAREVCERSGE